jgi:hypothetical protein
MAFFLTHFQYFGMAGSSLLLLAVFFSSMGYSGHTQERYSILNHFVSELGETGVASHADVFNTGLKVSGLLLVPFVLGLGLAIGNLWAWLGMLAGIGAAVACVLVGFFPMNKLEPHARAAMTFFRLGLVTIVLFGLSFFWQPAGRVVVPVWASAFSLVSVLAYVSFLLLPVFRPMPIRELDILNPAVYSERPRIWLLPLLEWLVFFTSVAWFLGVALVIH